MLPICFSKFLSFCSYSSFSLSILAALSLDAAFFASITAAETSPASKTYTNGFTSVACACDPPAERLNLFVSLSVLGGIGRTRRDPDASGSPTRGHVAPTSQL